MPVAHGDTRNVGPFHSKGQGAHHQLLGFTFRCAERAGWIGEITLLEADMRQIATTLAKLYCNAVSGNSSDFADDARRHVKETAA